MKADSDSFPETGETARHLGARPGVDLPLDELGYVQPRSGGMSVTADDPWKLPAHRRPVDWNGTGRDPIFKLNLTDLPSELVIRAQGKDYHYFMEPVCRCLFTYYQQTLSETRGSWCIVRP